MTQIFPFEKILTILARVEIFKSVPSNVLKELTHKMSLNFLEADQVIIRQGERGSSMFVVLKGDVKVHDKEYTIANLSEESFFGEFSLLDDEPRSLSVTTLVPSVVGNIQQADFYEILNQHPEITRDIIKVMLRRLRNQNQQIIMQLRQRQVELEKLVKERTIDLKMKNEDLEKTLAELKRTQEQLVQQEKLASLGQITAGIAHEIQNPLNFINNFSSLSKELAEELITAKNSEEQSEIISDLKFNLSRIEDHGKRADQIVKGMLLHSQSTKGEMEVADISSICNQAFNLACNSMDPAMKEMVIDITKNFEEGIPKLKVIPQELTRVLINIFNNAFYALNEKLKSNSSGYRPSLNISVIKEGEGVSITIRDNGTGIREMDKKKVFQPFFTTKPTGKGSGLGLSSGNEIIKLHGGSIKFDSKENEFTEFTVFLPATN